MGGRAIEGVCETRFPLFFFLAEEDDEELATLHPDRDWLQFQRGERAWILQTYLRLRESGHPVALVSSPPRRGVVVFHSKHRRELLACRPAGELILVGVRGDLSSPWIADFEIVQNQASADGRRSFFVPHWTQPGLIPRDATRGTRIRRAAYKGFAANLHPYFYGSEWREFLAARGIDWQADAAPYSAGCKAESLDWPNFEQVDLVLAVRPKSSSRSDSKPATKLYNAWLAGVPALLGPDTAFRELRRSPYDYLEVVAPENAKACVQRLLDEPELYSLMVSQGERRGQEFSPQSTLARWIEVLATTVPRRFAAGHDSWVRHFPVRARMSLRRLRSAARTGFPP